MRISVARRFAWVLISGAVALLLSCGGDTNPENSGAAASSGTSVGGKAGNGGASAGGTTGSAGSLPVGGSGGSPGAGGSGGSIDPPGPVLCGGIECRSGQACCLLDGTCFDLANPDACSYDQPPQDPTGQGRSPCASHATCAPHEFCMADDFQTCFGPGYCQPRDNCGSCGGDGDVCKVCACDGNTYPNEQTACLAGARVIASYHGGGCGETISIGGGGGGGRGGENPPLVVIPCAADAHCPAGERCCSRMGICYDAAYPILCSEPPPGTRVPCLDDTECFQGAEFCLADGCDGPGGCASISSGDCGVILDPVCGCDGVTYTSTDCAHGKGIRVRAAGSCSP